MNGLNVNGQRGPKEKYMNILRQVANRQTTEIVIELSDLKKVSRMPDIWLMVVL